MPINTTITVNIQLRSRHMRRNSRQVERGFARMTKSRIKISA